MRVVLPPVRWDAGVSAQSSGLSLLPDDLQTWMHQAIGVGMPPGAKLEIRGDREAQTVTGWPLRFVDAVITRDGKVIEARLGALYAFFEHAGSAFVRAADRPTLEPHVEMIAEWLRQARPSFAGEVAALADVYDLDAPREQAPPANKPKLVIAQRPDPRFGAELQLARLATETTREARIERAVLLLVLKRPEAALAELDGMTEAEAVSLRGRALAEAGRKEEAMNVWRDAVDATSRYNLGQSLFDARDYEGARKAFREAATAAPDDFLILRKVIQSELRLERWADAETTRAELHRVWATSSDPRAQLLHDAVIDQYESPIGMIHVHETFRPRDPAFHPLLAFSLVDQDGHARPERVVIETSDYAKERGSPFVIVVWKGKEHRIVGTAPGLPPYPEIRASAVELLRGVLSPPSGPGPSKPTPAG